MSMKTLALLLVLIAIAASRRSRSVLLWGQPHHWLGAALAALAHILGG
jgi:hypothetical protein